MTAAELRSRAEQISRQIDQQERKLAAQRDRDRQAADAAKNQ